ncbi:MAG: hypothetical protein P4L53_28115, partial [Candidatus Obscuribacterales bacterium]|nr:hypothetical protein [Candidatus Obscuribacterales bacterium]
PTKAKALRDISLSNPRVSGFFTGFPWDTAQNFAVRTGVSHPPGLGLDSRIFGGTLKKPGGEDDEIQCRAAGVARNGVCG